MATAGNGETAANGEQEAWEKSESKRLLRTELLSGAITDDMPPRAVFDMHPEVHGKWNYSNWTGNLRSLRNAIKRDRNRMQRDAIAYGHDLAIVKEKRPADAPTPWHRSPARALLKKDVDDGVHLTMTPKEMRDNTRDEYKAYDLSVFRKHIYQEVDSRPKRAIRFEKKKQAWKYPELHKNHPRNQASDGDGDDSDEVA